MGSTLGVFQSYHIVMLGLDNSGKTTILNRLKYQTFAPQKKTICFNSEKIYKKRKIFHIWDVGGQERTRSLWRSFVRNADLIIWVVDTNDVERMEESYVELNRLSKILEEGIPILLLANKRDLPGSVSMDHFVAELRLCIRKKNSVSLMGCCAVTGEGLEPVMEQIENMIRLSKSLKRKIRISWSMDTTSMEWKSWIGFSRGHALKLTTSKLLTNTLKSYAQMIMLIG